MKVAAGLTKQGVRNLSDLGPKRTKKKLATAEEGSAEPDGRPSHAPQAAPEAPVAPTEATST